MKARILFLGILLALITLGVGLVDSNSATARANSSSTLSAPLAAPIDPGFDLFETGQVTTGFAFSNEFTIPPSFFEPGSNPFAGEVCFAGDPIGNFQAHGVGSTDTIVQRLAPANLPTIPSNDTVPIEIVALNLVSCEPITVHYTAAPPELWDVKVTLSPTLPSTGQMTITKTNPNGGTFQSQLQVYPKFIFTRVSDHAQRNLDVGAIGLPPLSANLRTSPQSRSR